MNDKLSKDLNPFYPIIDKLPFFYKFITRVKISNFDKRNAKLFSTFIPGYNSSQSLIYTPTKPISKIINTKLIK